MVMLSEAGGFTYFKSSFSVFMVQLVISTFVCVLSFCFRLTDVPNICESQPFLIKFIVNLVPVYFLRMFYISDQLPTCIDGVS